MRMPGKNLLEPTSEYQCRKIGEHLFRSPKMKTGGAFTKLELIRRSTGSLALGGRGARKGFSMTTFGVVLLQTFWTEITKLATSEAA